MGLLLSSRSGCGLVLVLGAVACLRAAASVGPLNGVAGGNGIYVVVGERGAILRSSDAIFWTNQISATTNALRGATHGAGQFVAVGEAGTIVTSPNGAAWAQQVSGTSRALVAATYGNGRFVAVSEQNTIVSSLDGITWTNRTLAGTNVLKDVAFGNGRFVAVGASAFSNGVGILYSSTNGFTWSLASSNLGPPLTTVTYGGGTFIALGHSGIVMRSTNGLNWQQSYPGVPPAKDVTFGDGKFIAVIDGFNYVFTSVDGVNWQSFSLNANAFLRGVAYADGYFVGVGATLGGHGAILISRDVWPWSDVLDPLFAPIIVEQPVGAEFFAGSGVSLSVYAVGNPPPTFQWRFNGSAIPGATESYLNLNDATPSQAGDYDAVVRNEIGAVTSLVATVSFATKAPEFVNDLEPSYAGPIGGDVYLQPYVEASPAPAYIWFYNGMLIPGETNAFLALTNVTAIDAGQYFVVAVNGLGAAASRVTTLTVAPSVIWYGPYSTFLNSNQSLRLSVSVNSTRPVTYQWYFNNSSIAGATDSYLNRVPATTNDAGSYFVVVSNSFGMVTSQVAVVGVNRMAPYISEQPQSQLGLVDAGVNLVITAVGSPPLFVQWRKNGFILPGAEHFNLYLTPTLNDAGAYDVVIRNAFGSVTSIVATVTVTSAPPRILYGPMDIVAREGSYPTFEVGVEAWPLPRFQWRRDGIPIAGATDSFLQLSQVTAADSGNYSVVVTNSAGAVTSRVARLTLYGVPPYFVTQPIDAPARAGEYVTLYAEADGAPEPEYQWHFNGEPLPGETFTYLTIPDIPPSRAGLYTMTASNASGIAVSRVATVTVRLEAPAFVQQPFGRTLLWGESLSLYASATGGPPPTYQWLFNGAPLPGSTNQNLYYQFATPAQSGNYVLVASNIVGVATSQVAVVTVNAQAPSFVTQPAGGSALWGNYFGFYGYASGGPPPSYQWLFNGLPIAGATNTYLQFSYVVPANAGNYRLVAFNAVGTATSAVAVLTVNAQAPTFTQQPSGQAVLWGDQVNFYGDAVGGPPPTFQWLFNNVQIPGATSRSLYLNPVTPSQAGSYRLVASNPVGVTTSQVAVLTVRSEAPIFITHPISQTVLWGSYASMFANVSGGPPPAVQWLFNGAPIFGQTNTVLSFGYATPDRAGTYSMLASNVVGVATSQVAILTVTSQPPVFVSEPYDQTVLWGEFVQFYAFAQAGPPADYQWFFNGMLLPGATNYYLNVEFAGTNQAGFYHVVATNLFGAATSRVASLVVETAPPNFGSEPNDIIALWGDTVGFYSNAAGGPPPDYQWRRDGVPIPDATNNFLNLFNVTTNNVGAYDVIASNFLGAVTSRVAVLEVQVQEPQFSYSFAGAEVVEGTDVRLQAYAPGAPPPALFLRFNDSPLALPFAEGGGFLLTEVTTNDSGNYSFIASNFVGSVTSQVAILTVLRGGPLDRWTRRNPLPQGDNLLAVTHGNSRFVATGERGSVVISTNGLNWTAQRLRADADLAGVAYGNGLFVSVSRSGNILTSTNAVQWLPRILDTQLSLEGIAFGNGRFVAVGFGPGNLSLVSTNGIDWVRGASSFATRFKGVAYGNGRFVGVLQGQGIWPAILVSFDGLDWTAGDGSIVDNLENVAFADGQFVAVGSNGAILTSPDALVWTRRVSGTTRRVIEVAYGNGRWVAVAVRGIILSSADGITWRSETSGTPDRLEGITFADGQFVALGENGTTLTSTNGATWTKRNIGSTRDLDGIAIDSGGQIIAVGKFGTILTTPDGVHITDRASGTTNDLHGVGFANGLYVAVGDGGAIVTSDNALTWTTRTFGATNYFKAVTYSNGLWVAVGTRGAIITSLDGSDWTLRDSGTTDDLNDVAYGNGFFMVVGDDNPPNGTVRVSTDGVSWVNRSFQTGKNLRGVTFANGVFLVVGNDGIIYATADGVNWQPRASGIVGNGRNLRNVTYAEGQWIVVGNDGIIVTSTNTVDWTRRAPRTPENLHGVRYVNGTFVAIGNRGTILQSGRFIGPELKVLEWIHGLGFVFAIEGEIDRDYVLQGSDDLQTWADLLDFNNTQTTTLFLDEEALFLPMRFYRVVAQ
jgi:hypothetical protein